MTMSKRLLPCLGALALAMSGGAIAADAAAPVSVIDNWSKMTLPPPPAMNPVTVDPAHTALLILDMAAVNCVPEKRPACVRSLPYVKNLLGAARAHKAFVIYSAGAPNGEPPHMPADVIAPIAGEPLVQAPVDKFLNSNLEVLLKSHNITTVIVTGTSAEGAVLYTASGAALRGLKTIVPVDTYSAIEPFAEAYTAWHLKNAPAALSRNIVITRSDMITFAQ